MAKVKLVEYKHDGVVYQSQWQYMCPGCGCIHALSPLIHIFNGNFNEPTFSPSCLYDFDIEHRCHSFISNGFIQFLPDCAHELKGQTVELKGQTVELPQIE